MPDVSVIIPVYNIKTLLPRCVASLQAQTWQDFEVWLVDDGSTDGSGPLCDELAAKDARPQRRIHLRGVLAELPQGEI